MASLFQACKAAVRNKEGGTFNIGGYDIDIEMYSQQDIQDDIQYGDVAFGDSDESKIVLVAGNTITIPAGYTLTPDKPKKSLVIFCNELVNNGTISMYQKAPNVLPHDYFIIEGSIIGANRSLIIPAYANNEVTLATLSTNPVTPSSTNERNGQNGINRNCGAGGFGPCMWGTVINVTNGSGYAFGGGAGTGGINLHGGVQNPSLVSVDSTYPMRGGNYTNADGMYFVTGGVGNPSGASQARAGDYGQYVATNFGCGGRIIIFCINFINNGIINVNGTNVNLSGKADAIGGASGGGSVDLFYTVLGKQGTITANGGKGGYCYTDSESNNISYYVGSGGDGSITLTQWNLDKVIKEERKMFTKDNWVYLFNNYSQRLREDVI